MTDQEQIQCQFNEAVTCYQNLDYIDMQNTYDKACNGCEVYLEYLSGRFEND